MSAPSATLVDQLADFDAKGVDPREGCESGIRLAFLRLDSFSPRERRFVRLDSFGGRKPAAVRRSLRSPGRRQLGKAVGAFPPVPAYAAADVG